MYLMGVSTRNVLGTNHKNAADMQLCIDALEVMYTRPDIGTFVLVAGDRDYIPLLQHLRRQARQVLVAGFRESVSGDLLQNIGADHFIDARELLPDGRVEHLEKRRADRQRTLEESRRLREQGLPGGMAAGLAARAGAMPEGARDAAGAAVPAAGTIRPIVPVAARPAPAFPTKCPTLLRCAPGQRCRAPNPGLYSGRVSEAGGQAAAAGARAVAGPVHAPARRRNARAARLRAPRPAQPAA
ncbi:NYN domain-containing protein [Hymenobacter humi]|uniref:NYN domain-containing protein n=1 Tax=Hymenobacter humi TaxID=1411620 RepID=A0ABW2U4X0_9BACT